MTLSNRYTDAPELHSHFVLGSWQLLGWLLWHPSAWVNYVARMDSALPADFALANLQRKQWRNPQLHRLLVCGYAGWPLCAGLLVGLVSWLLHQPPQHILLNVTLAVTTSATIGLIMGITVSLAGGIGISMAVGLAAGLALTLTHYKLTHASIGMPNINIGQDQVRPALAFGLACAVPAGIGGRVLLNIAQHLRTPLATTVTQRMTSLILGLPVAIAGVLLAGVIASKIARNEERLALTTVLLGLFAYSLFTSGALIVRTERWRYGLVYGWLIAFANATILSLAYAGAHLLLNVAESLAYFFMGIAYSTACCVLFCAIFSLSFAAARRVAGAQVGALVAALMTGMGGISYYVFAIGQYRAPLGSFMPVLWPVALVTVAGLTLHWWLPVLFYPTCLVWNFLLQRSDEQRGAHHFYRHSAFWDEQQFLPLFGLADYLVLVMEAAPTEGQAALTYLTRSRQSWAAQVAQIELDARQLEQCRDVIAISNSARTLAVGELQGPASALLRTFSRISSEVEVALAQVNTYNRRMALSAVADRLDGLLRELIRSNETYAGRFYPIAEQWQKLVTGHVQALVQAAERNQEIDNPYVVGVPLTQHQELFVGRTAIIARIEELLASRDYPPLLLYGQRRMGKTSLLHNLKWLLPFRIMALFIDLQGPVSNASNHAGFLYNIAKLMHKAALEQGVALPELALATLAPDPFTFFDDWLDTVERTLVAQGRETILLALDEFEALDAALTRKQLDESAVLGMLRHIVQYRTRFKVLLAGSHTLEEFQRWAGYLINAQTIHLSYLNEAEATQLIERPVRDFPLRYQPAARAAILQLTRGHPYLIQLLCAELINLKNGQAPDIRRLARRSDVDAVIPETLAIGDQFFMDIQLNQIDPDSLTVLHALAKQSATAAVHWTALLAHLPDSQRLTRVLAQLRRRELIEETDGCYSFQVELIRRWFAGEHWI